MPFEIISEKYQKQFDLVVTHPLQSWSWGEFREKLGQKVIRLGQFNRGKLTDVTQFSVHKIPGTPWTIGYCPRGGMPTAEMAEAVRAEAKKNNCIFVKFEPNVTANSYPLTANREIHDSRFTIHDSRKLSLRPGKALFTPFTFQVDLTKSEEELLANMKPKTRYNIRLAEKKGVEVEEDNSDEAFEEFQKLTEETTRRQKFFAHDRRYRYLMWQMMKKAGIAKLIVARYAPNVIPSDPDVTSGESRDLAKRPEILSAWILFLFNGIGYYPYGASSEIHRDLMASNLVAWRALQFAKRAGCKKFDFWGSLGPEPDKNDPWYGFHRFKEGYGGKLVELVGTWDLVINPLLYSVYKIVDKIRWGILRRRL